MEKNKDKKEKKKNKFNLTRLLLVLVFSILGGIIIFIAVGGYIYSITPPGKTSSIYDGFKILMKPGTTAFSGKDTLNILCLGLDHNYTEQGILYTKGARTDTIFVLSIDKEAKYVNMLSIPRDTWVYIDGYGYNKINSAYSFGGLELAKKTISEFLGIKIDHYIIIKIKAGTEIVDALDGLNIDVEKDMDYDDNWGNLHIHLKQGEQKLTGTEAVGYARFRHDEEGDWGRMRRQQQVINALVKELKKPENILKIDKLIKIANANIETDLKPAEMLDICRCYKDFDKKNMATGIIHGYDDTNADGLSIIIPDNNEKIKLVRQLLLRQEEIIIPNGCTVKILNGSQTEGLASELADHFERKGYKVSRIGDADKYDYEDSVIIPNNAKKGSIEEITNLLGYITVGQKQEAESNEDYTIIIGNKWLKWKEEHPEIFTKKEVKVEETPVDNYNYNSGYNSNRGYNNYNNNYNSGYEKNYTEVTQPQSTSTTETKQNDQSQKTENDSTSSDQQKENNVEGEQKENKQETTEKPIEQQTQENIQQSTNTETVEETPKPEVIKIPHIETTEQPVQTDEPQNQEVKGTIIEVEEKEIESE